MRWREDHHVEQSISNACVAACVGMVRRWRGQAHDEAALMSHATDDGLSMRDAAKVLGGSYCVWDPPQLASQLDLLFEGERCLSVKVSGPVYVKLVGEPPETPSRHGTLAPPGDYGGPLHALLIVAVEDNTVRYFDPWYPSKGQPFTMRLDHLLLMFAGAAVTIPL